MHMIYNEDAKFPQNKQKLGIIQRATEKQGISLALNYHIFLHFALERPDIPTEIYSPNHWTQNEYGLDDRVGRILVSNVAVRELSDLAFEGMVYKALSYYYVIGQSEIENPELHRKIINGSIPEISLDIGSEISGVRQFPNKPMAAFRSESWNYEFKNNTLNKDYVGLTLNSLMKPHLKYVKLILEGLNFKFD